MQVAVWRRNLSTDALPHQRHGLRHRLHARSRLCHSLHLPRAPWTTHLAAHQLCGPDEWDDVRSAVIRYMTIVHAARTARYRTANRVVMMIVAIWILHVNCCCNCFCNFYCNSRCNCCFRQHRAKFHQRMSHFRRGHRHYLDPDAGRQHSSSDEVQHRGGQGDRDILLCDIQ